MSTFVALFRGINVGGKNILPMKELIKILEDLGLSKVQSYIQSGNLVFQAESNSTAELAREIGSVVLKNYGLDVQVLVLSFPEYKSAVVANPYPEGEADPKSLHLYFLQSPPANPELQRLEEVQSSSERFMLIGNVFYLYAPEGIGRSRLAANVEKRLGVVTTARNWRSVMAIMGLAA